MSIIFKLNYLIYDSKNLIGDENIIISVFNDNISSYKYKEVIFNPIIEYLILNSKIINDAKNIFYKNQFNINSFSILKIYWIDNNSFGIYIIIRNFNENENIIECITLSAGPITNYIVGIINK
jgi:hypothetical protein